MPHVSGPGGGDDFLSSPTAWRRPQLTFGHCVGFLHWLPRGREKAPSAWWSHCVHSIRADPWTPGRAFCISLSVEESMTLPAGKAENIALMSRARHTEKGWEWPSAAQAGILRGWGLLPLPLYTGRIKDCKCHGYFSIVLKRHRPKAAYKKKAFK